LAKKLLARLSSEEETLFVLIGVDKDLTTQLISLERKLRGGPNLYQEVKKFDLRNRLNRIFRGYRPKVSCFKSWVGPKKIPEKRVIGVGYRDKGTLSTAPAWQDQIVRTEGDIPKNREEILSEVFSLLSFLAFLDPGDHSRADEA
jgi:hypothetical protein